MLCPLVCVVQISDDVGKTKLSASTLQMNSMIVLHIALTLVLSHYISIYLSVTLPLSLSLFDFVSTSPSLSISLSISLSLSLSGSPPVKRLCGRSSRLAAWG